MWHIYLFASRQWLEIYKKISRSHMWKLRSRRSHNDHIWPAKRWAGKEIQQDIFDMTKVLHRWAPTKLGRCRADTHLCFIKHTGNSKYEDIPIEFGTYLSTIRTIFTTSGSVRTTSAKLGSVTATNAENSWCSSRCALQKTSNHLRKSQVRYRND